MDDNDNLFWRCDGRLAGGLTAFTGLSLTSVTYFAQYDRAIDYWWITLTRQGLTRTIAPVSVIKAGDSGR